jgi:hypothetical protein
MVIVSQQDCCTAGRSGDEPQERPGEMGWKKRPQERHRYGDIYFT